MKMESPIHGRSCIGNGQATKCHHSCKLASLELDSVAATYGLGKTNAIAVARRGYTLDLLGQPMADIKRLSKKQHFSLLHSMASIHHTLLWLIAVNSSGHVRL